MYGYSEWNLLFVSFLEFSLGTFVHPCDGERAIIKRVDGRCFGLFKAISWHFPEGRLKTAEKLIYNG
jgi:hypothetical protein